MSTHRLDALRAALETRGLAVPTGRFDTELALWDAATEGLQAWDHRALRPGFDDRPASFVDLVQAVPHHVHGPAVMAAWLSGCRFLCGQADDDEETRGVQLAAAADGTHRVVRYDPRQVVFDQVGWSSIAGFVGHGDAAQPLGSLAPPWRDPVHLSRRTSWLTARFAGVGFATTALDTEHAAAADDYPKEIDGLAHAHIAVYWLLHHYAAENVEMFRDVVRRTERCDHPWVRQVRHLLTSGHAAMLDLSDARRAELKQASRQLFSTAGNRSAPSPASAVLEDIASTPAAADKLAIVNRWWTAPEQKALRDRASSWCAGDALVRLGPAPVAEADLAAVETALSQSLPRSYRRFLAAHGGFEIVPSGFRTTPVGELVTYSQYVVGLLVANKAPTPALDQREKAIAFYQRESDAAVFLGGYRDHRDEAPIAVWWHDDAFVGRSEVEYYESVVAAGRAYVAAHGDRGPKPAIAPADTALVADIRAVLAGGGPQRERLAAIAARVDELAAASDPERWTIAHDLKRSIKSRKLVEPRDAVLARVRPDGEQGSAPLPRLARTPKPIPEPQGFGTFDDFVTGELERLVEHIADLWS